MGYAYYVLMLLAAVTKSKVASQANAIVDENYIFTAPELTVNAKSPHGKLVYLEAFKIKDNDKITAGVSANPKGVSLLRFISIGHPHIVAPIDRVGKALQSLIVPTANGFHFYVKMLPQAYREALASYATEKYETSVTISQSQIVLMAPDSFTCNVLLTSPDDLTVSVKGKVKTFRRDPLKVSFKVEPNSYVYNIIRSGTLTPDEIAINCEITKRAHHAQNDRLIITSQQIDQLSLKTKLFGNADSVYVSRQQLNVLGRDIMQSLNVHESYESDGSFENNFVSDFLAKVGVQNSFTPTPIEEVLSHLSPYNVESDLRPEEIIKDFSDVFKVETYNGKQRIIANRESSQLKKESRGVSGGGKASGEGWGVKVSLSAEYAKNKSNEWAESGKSLDDQLHELNSKSLSAVKFKREGLKIIPKSLDVAQMSRSQMSQSMSFSRIRRKLNAADFHRVFKLKLPVDS